MKTGIIFILVLLSLTLAQPHQNPTISSKLILSHTYTQEETRVGTIIDSTRFLQDQFKPIDNTITTNSPINSQPFNNDNQLAFEGTSTPQTQTQASTTINTINPHPKPVIQINSNLQQPGVGAQANEIPHQQFIPQTQTTDTTTNTSLPVNNPTPTPVQPKIFISQIDKAILGKGFKIDQGISYQILKVNEIKSKYLFLNFQMAQKDSWQKTILTITPQGSSTILTKCIYDGTDSCYLANNQLKINMTLFITIQCEDDCNYNLKAHWSDMQHLKPGDQLVFMFGEIKNQLYHIDLQKQGNFEEIRIHLAPRVTRRPFDNVKMYLKFGAQAQPTEEDFDIKSINLWQDGQGIFLTKQNLKMKTLNLLVVGQAETTYRLTCQKVTEINHEIQNGEHIYEYVDAGQTKTYHITFDAKKYDEYSLRFSVLSGEVNVGYYLDSQFKTKYPIEPFQYMKDSQYLFIPKQSAEIIKNGLFIKIEAQKRDSTFTLKLAGRKQMHPIELNEHVYGFVVVKDTKFAYFNFKRWAIETDAKNNIKFTVYTISIFGVIQPQFRVCKTTLDDCTSLQSYQNSSILLPSKKHQDVSQKRVYQFQIQESLLKKINAVEQQANIIIKLATQKIETAYNTSMMAIQFVNNNKVLYLREGRPLQQKLNQGQMKLYKYINSDQNVQEIRIHFNQISGHIQFMGSSKSSESKLVAVQSESNTIRFTKDLTKPIFVTVQADSRAVFGVSMQIIHKSSNSDNANVYNMGEDLTYTVKIKPNSYAIFEVVPIYYEFYFSYSSSQSVLACELDLNTNKCFNMGNNETITPKLAVKGELVKQLEQRKHRVKITNPFTDSIAEVSVLFHSRSFDHCERKKIGTVYSEVVKDKSCFSYILQENSKTLDIYVSKKQFAALSFSILLCGNAIKGAGSIKNLHITNEIIKKFCYYSQQAKEVSIMWSVNTNNADKIEKSVKVDFVAQYQGNIIQLPEGVGYNVVSTAKEGVLHLYSFKFINKRATKVILNQIRGRFKTFAKAVSITQIQKQTISEINYHYYSQTTVDYSQEPIIIISEQEIQAMPCTDCALLIAVYSLQQIGKQVQFNIQIVQKVQNLNDNSVVAGYLEPGSYAYYTYTAKDQQNTTLLFILSDHNQQCANMYLGLAEYPGPSYHIGKTLGGNQLIYRHSGGEKKYYLTVQGTKLCDYTISVITIDSSVHQLQRGKQNLIRLAKGQIKYFTFENANEQPFKIISLTKFGQIKLHINKSFIGTQRKSFTTKELSLQNFAFTSQQTNTLTIDTNHPQFCKSCTYFLAVQALKHTQSTLYLTYSQTIISLHPNKVLSDYLTKKNDYTLASYNQIQKTQLLVTVHKGEIEVSAVYKQKQFSQKFKAKGEVQSMTIDISLDEPKIKKFIPQSDIGIIKKKNIIQRIPLNLIMSAVSDHCSYSLQLKSVQKGDLNSSSALYQKVIAGEPNHIIISSTKALCLQGFFRDQSEQLLITSNNDNQNKLNNLIIEGQINGQKANIQKQLFKNILSLKLRDAKNKTFFTSSYQLCLKLNSIDSNASTAPEKANLKQNQKASTETEAEDDQDEDITFKAVVSQNNQVNILSSDVEAVVRGSNIFVIHSEGQFLLDVFQCKGQAKINYGNSLKQIKSTIPKSLDSVSLSDQRHAVKITQNQTTFIEVDSQHSIVRWIPMNYETQQGMGYLRYGIGDMKYTSGFKYINIEFQPLQMLKTYKNKANKLLSAHYMLFVSNESSLVELATRCDPTQSKDVISFDLGQYTSLKKGEDAKKYLSHKIDKQILQSNFPGSQNIFFNIIVKVSIEILVQNNQTSSYSPLDDEHEHYRFIFNRQQIPLQHYKQNKIQSIPYHFLILIIVSLAALFLLLTYLFTRKIVPMIARLKNSNLVEDQDPQPERKDDLEVPASSDRNQRAPDVVVQTDEKMAS